MSVYTHVAIGAAAGAATGNPALAFLLGVATHAVSDAVAHFDFAQVWLEVVLAVAAAGFLCWLGDWRITVLIGVIGAATPDLDNLLISLKVLPERFKVFPSHGNYLRHGKELGFGNAAVQLVIFCVAALWVYVAPELL